MHSSSVYHRALINIGVSSATYRSVRLCKLANTLSGRKAIMFEDKSLVKNKEIDQQRDRETDIKRKQINALEHGKKQIHLIAVTMLQKKVLRDSGIQQFYMPNDSHWDFYFLFFLTLLQISLDKNLSFRFPVRRSCMYAYAWSLRTIKFVRFK